jgi:hypothetical protein
MWTVGTFWRHLVVVAHEEIIDVVHSVRLEHHLPAVKINYTIKINSTYIYLYNQICICSELL